MWKGLPVGTECWKASTLKFHEDKNNAKNFECNDQTEFPDVIAWADKYYGRNFNKQGCWVHTSQNHDNTQKTTRYSVDCSVEGKIYIETFVNTADCSGPQQEESPFAWNVINGKADCERWTVSVGPSEMSYRKVSFE